MDQVTSTGVGGPDGLDVTASAYGLALRGMGLRRQLPRVQARKLAPAVIASDIERLDKYLK